MAVTDLAALIVTLQVELEPVQAPLHPVNVYPVSGEAVIVTVEPAATLLEHATPQ